jgi:hypothetical protein
MLEILNHVLEWLSTDGTQDITVLARVNQAFSRLALEFLWKAQSQLSVLFQCFPVDLWYIFDKADGKGQILVYIYIYTYFTHQQSLTDIVASSISIVLWSKKIGIAWPYTAQ